MLSDLNSSIAELISFVTLMLCLLSMTTFAQVHDEISSAMEEFDYDKVINLISPGTKDSLLLSTRIQALKAMTHCRFDFSFCKGYYRYKNIDRFGRVLQTDG